MTGSKMPMMRTKGTVAVGGIVAILAGCGPARTTVFRFAPKEGTTSTYISTMRHSSNVAGRKSSGEILLTKQVKVSNATSAGVELRVKTLEANLRADGKPITESFKGYLKKGATFTEANRKKLLTILNEAFAWKKAEKTIEVSAKGEGEFASEAQVCITVPNRAVEPGETWAWNVMDDPSGALTMKYVKKEMHGGVDCYLLDVTFGREPTQPGITVNVKSDAKVWLEAETCEVVELLFEREMQMTMKDGTKSSQTLYARTLRVEKK